MKNKEELNALKEEVETLNKKLAQLTDEELKQVSGGVILPAHIHRLGLEDSDYDIVYKKDGEEVEDLTKPGEYCAPISFR